MAAKIIVPSEGSDVCLISECCVHVGDTVHAGDLICTVELLSEKAETHIFSRSELEFFDNIRDFKKNYLKNIRKKHL